MRNKSILLLFMVFPVIFLITSVSAKISLYPNIFGGYRVISSTGNESIIFNVDITGATICLIPKITHGQLIPIEEIESTNITIDKDGNENLADNIKTTIKRFFIPPFVPVRNDKDEILENLIRKENKFCKTIENPLNNLLLKFGLETITIVGDVSYNSTDINVTQETGFGHLNISSNSPYDSLVLYLPFDNNRTQNTNITYDYSVNDFAFVSNATFNTSFLYGGAYSFPSGGLVYYDDSQYFNFISPSTITMWVNTGNTLDKRGLFVNRAPIGYNGSFLFREEDTNGTLRFIRWNGTSDSFQSWQTSTLLLNVSRWYFLALVYNSTNAIFYINNNSEIPVFTSSNGGAAIQPLTIGLDYGSSNSFFNGSIDEVMFFNMSLNSTQVLDIYNNQSQRFVTNGTQIFQNLNFGTNNTVNISIKDNQTNLGSYLQVQVNEGQIQNLTSGRILLYNSSGNLTNANITIHYQSSPNQFYTPIVAGNITIDDFLIDTSAPNITFVSPSQGQIFQKTPNSLSNILVNFSLSDIAYLDTCSYSVTGKKTIGTTRLSDCTLRIGNNFTLTNLEDGTYTVSITANDTTGNSNSSTTSFTVTSASIGAGGGGSSSSIGDPLQPTDLFLCNETYKYIQQYSTITDKISESIESIESDYNKTYDYITFQRYLNNWQPYCSDALNKTLEEPYVCDKIYYFLIDNPDYTIIDMKDLGIKLEERVKLSNNLLNTYLSNFNDKCSDIVGKTIKIEGNKSKSIISSVQPIWLLIGGIIFILLVFLAMNLKSINTLSWAVLNR